MTDQYIITEDDIGEFQLRNISCSEFIDKSRSHPYNPQYEREKVLNEIDAWADLLPPYSGKDMPKVMLKKKIAELRQEGKLG